MTKHWQYLKYVLRHKWFVWLALWDIYKQNLWAVILLWQGVTHDWSKFLPSEWGPYVDYFYGGPYPERHYGDVHGALGDKWTQPWAQERFDKAWNYHQKRHPHHWQFWVLREDDGATKCLEMPERFVMEMLADWRGAGRAITGVDNTPQWYAKNRSKIMLHPRTREIVEWWLAYPQDQSANT